MTPPYTDFAQAIEGAARAATAVMDSYGLVPTADPDEIAARLEEHFRTCFRPAEGEIPTERTLALEVLIASRESEIDKLTGGTRLPFEVTSVAAHFFVRAMHMHGFELDEPFDFFFLHAKEGFSRFFAMHPAAVAA